MVKCTCTHSWTYCHYDPIRHSWSVPWPPKQLGGACLCGFDLTGCMYPTTPSWSIWKILKLTRKSPDQLSIDGNAYVIRYIPWKVCCDTYWRADLFRHLTHLQLLHVSYILLSQMTFSNGCLKGEFGDCATNSARVALVCFSIILFMVLI